MIAACCSVWGFLLFWDPEDARAAKQTYRIVEVLSVFTYSLSGPIQSLDNNHPRKTNLSCGASLPVSVSVFVFLISLRPSCDAS